MRRFLPALTQEGSGVPRFFSSRGLRAAQAKKAPGSTVSRAREIIEESLFDVTHA
jgi:hypothetical protein